MAGDWPEGAITTTNDDEGVWYVSTEYIATTTKSVAASGFTFRDISKEWVADQWFRMAEKSYHDEFAHFEKHIEEKDHLSELEELFEI